MTPTALPLPRGEHSSFLPPSFYEAPQHSTYTPPLPAAPTPKKRTTSKKASPDSPVIAKRRGRPPIIHSNSLKPYLRSYSSPGHALWRLPLLGHIVTGAVNLDYGDNEKPLGMKTALALLRSLDVISTEAILEHMERSMRPCCERHAQRLAQCLRIIERAARAATSKWPVADHELDPYATSHNIVPCSAQGCSVCRPSAEVEHAWSLAAAEQDDLTNTFATVSDETVTGDGWADQEDALFDAD